MGDGGTTEDWSLDGRLMAAEDAATRATETAIQRCRVWCVVVALLQTALYRGDRWWLGWTGVLILVATTVWVQWALAAERRRERLPLIGTEALLAERGATRRGRTYGKLAAIGAVGMVGDAIAVVVIMGNLLSNPEDPIELLPLVLVLEAAARWGTVGGLTWGALGGLLSAGWAIAVHRGDGMPIPLAFTTFRVAVMVLVGLMLGNIVRQSRHQRRAAEAVFNSSRDLVGTFDLDGRLRSINPACEAILGFSPEELLDREQSFLFDLDRYPFGLAGVGQQAGAQMVEVRILHKDGRLVWVELDLLPDPEVGLIYMIGRDVSGRRRAESELRHRVDNDALTGIWNRHSVVAYLDRMLEKGYHPALVFIDLDRFKAINDDHGHVAGDRVLVEVASRLCEATGEDGTVARYAGDEFCVVVDDPDDAVDLVARVEQALAPPVDLGERVVVVEASLGMARSRPGDRAEHLVDRADQAMYDRKGSRRPA